MKHLLILLFIALSFNTMAQKYSLNATYFVYSVNGETVDEDNVDIDMTLNTDIDRLTIYSRETQVIDFDVLRTYTDSDGYFVIESSATDTDWKNIKLKILMHNERGSVIIAITYPSYSYAYVCEFI